MSSPGNQIQWCLKTPPREWQSIALQRWQSANKGVVSVVTGGGKTIFAFLCMKVFADWNPDARFIVLVPTLTLLDQWYVSLQEDFGVREDEIACFSSQEKADKPACINILVINTGRKTARKLAAGQPTFLIVDECHRAGSPENAKALAGHFEAALGLSATPEREYDEGFQRHVVPALGPVIFEYDYVQASKDKVIASFDLINVQIEFLDHERQEYEKLTRRAAILYQKSKVDPDSQSKLKRVLQKRAGVSAQARMRIPVAAKIADEHRGMKTIIFHERVNSAINLYAILKKRNHSACLYHSKIAPNFRRDNLRLFRQGVFDVLISCRALDEGMNVPETTVAVIASSTASQRQRIQRLGRVLRPSKGKDKALIYTLFATEYEKKRLALEEEKLEGVATSTGRPAHAGSVMAKILVGDEWFDEMASTSIYESEFEQMLFQEAGQIFYEYLPVPFKTVVFSADGDAKPDFALVHKQYRSWWVVEAEMGHHSLEGHVLPQVRRLARAQYDEPEAEYLCQNSADLDPARMREMIKGEQPRVLVVVNVPVPGWQEHLRPYDAVIAIFQIFRSKFNRYAYRINGEFPSENTEIISTCRCWDIHRFLKIDSPASLGVERGAIVTLHHETGAIEWERTDTGGVALLHALRGHPLEKGAVYEILRQGDGTLAIQRSKKRKHTA